MSGKSNVKNISNKDNILSHTLFSVNILKILKGSHWQIVIYIYNVNLEYRFLFFFCRPMLKPMNKETEVVGKLMNYEL